MVDRCGWCDNEFKLSGWYADLSMYCKQEHGVPGGMYMKFITCTSEVYISMTASFIQLEKSYRDGNVYVVKD